MKKIVFASLFALGLFAASTVLVNEKPSVFIGSGYGFNVSM